MASPQPLSPVGFPPASGGFPIRHCKVLFRRNRRGECSSFYESSGRANEHQAYIWDLLNTIPQDCKLVAKQSRLRLPTVIYFLSKYDLLFFLSFYSISPAIRLSTFGFVVFSAIYQSESNDFAIYQILIGFLAAPISNCFNSLKAVAILFIFAISSTSLLFFFRARAVFRSTPLATVFFGVLWLGVLGGSLTISTAIEGANLGPTPYCTTGVVRFYSVAAVITPLINDSIVFFAISWRLCSNNWAHPTLRNDVRTMVFGDHLPSFSKSLLQDGQVYFLSVF